MRHIQSRKGLYVNIQGVAWPGAGLEIKERTQSADDKPKLKGFFSSRGFHSTSEEAVSAAWTDILLKEYRLRCLRRGLMV